MKIECCHCRECFEPEKIEYSDGQIIETDDIEEMKNYAEDSGVRFDCPHCEEVQYLSDCDFY